MGTRLLELRSGRSASSVERTESVGEHDASERVSALRANESVRAVHTAQASVRCQHREDPSVQQRGQLEESSSRGRSAPLRLGRRTRC